jgi:hypothetical protein
MRQLAVAMLIALFCGACTGGAAGDPDDDIGDLFVLTHSPGNGDQLESEDAELPYNPLLNPTLTNPGAVTIVFSNSVAPESVLNPDPSDPAGTRNVRLFYFDPDQGPFDPSQPPEPGVNPPGASIVVPASSSLASTHHENDTLIIRPTGIDDATPLPAGQYSVTVEAGVQGADGDGLRGAEYFFFFRVGRDTLGPTVVASSPAPGEMGVHPDQEIRITMSETILASTVNDIAINVTFQPAGAPAPITIPGTWYTDGGNGPGNNLPVRQLDRNGIPGTDGTSPRNGVDLVFRPDLRAFPINLRADDPFCNPTDPPRKGNLGFPLGQAITVTLLTSGSTVTDTALNPIPAGSPNTSFTFQTAPAPRPVYAPNANGAVYYGDTIGVGVIDVDSSRTPYRTGPIPARPPNSVVQTSGPGGPHVVRVPVPDLVDLTTDQRPWTAFYSLAVPPLCPLPDTLYTSVLYAASAGGQVVVIDTYRMTPMGRFAAPSPGGLALTALGEKLGRLAVSNASANTVTLFDVSQVRWVTGPRPLVTAALTAGVASGRNQLILSEEDFARLFPRQRPSDAFPAGPPVIGTLTTGVSPSRVALTHYSGSMGIEGFPCFSPIGSLTPILCTLNSADATMDFSELVNLDQSRAIAPDLAGVNLAAAPTDVAWAPYSTDVTGAQYCFVSTVGGTVELFATGRGPSVRSGTTTNLAPNRIVNSIGGLGQPSAVQWIPNGQGVRSNNRRYSQAVLVAETGENRLRQLAITREFPSNLFQDVGSHAAGVGPVDITGDPAPVGVNGQFVIVNACGPSFTRYYTANAGEGSVFTSSYTGGVIGTTISVPGVVLVASWWR